MNDSARKFWLSDQAANVFEIANAEQKTVQPIVAELIEQFRPKTLLDYGCGDSFVSRLLNPAIKIGLFDINLNESKKAFEHLRERDKVLYETIEEIPGEFFDCIVFSLVLICLESKAEFIKILANFQRFRRKDGRLIIVSTHPCFRQYDYRPFYTEYTKGKEFDYFKAFDQFEVYIRDIENRAVNFIDYHWTMADTLNVIIDSGFTLEKMIEVPDSTFDNIPANKKFSPFVILICK